MGSKKETTTNQAGKISPQAQQMLDLLAGQAGNAVNQTGDLSALARGDVSASQADLGLSQQAQEASGAIARSEMEANMQAMLRQLEDSSLGRGVSGSTLETVAGATMGEDLQRQTNQLNMQQQGQSAQNMMNLPFQRAQTQLSANQLLLARLTGAAQPTLDYDAMIRQLNQSTTKESPNNLTGQLVQAGVRGGAAAITGGTSEAAYAAKDASKAGYPVN